MTKNKTGILNKLYGGLHVSWPAVILYAAGTAVLSSVFLILPVFKNTSFERMGVNLEAWIFFAVILMSNCKKPLESACKTFVFFLVSQPLIYLIQVPFTTLGWGIFRFYKYWFIWTILTFPMAYVGWYIRKRNWLSVLIFVPVLVFLGYTIFESWFECVHRFPHLLVTMLFCILQVLLYIYVFFPQITQKCIGILIPAAVAVFFALKAPQADLQVVETLPGDPSFSDDAVIVVEDPSVCSVQLHSAEDDMVYIYAHKYGTTEVVITEGEKEFRYSFEVYRDQSVTRIRIEQVEP
ncbi:MAG: pilus assembly protein N-terminal domain-containing protein [Solobacterium sp.]|nr:pilus assembly protein N-terminal domain-containing protein [Solobacterium sp.]